MAQLSTEPVPNALSQQDAVALIGILAVLEGEHSAGHIAERLSHRFGERLERAGLLVGAWRGADLRQALHDLNHRLRYALGEHDEPPHPGF